MDRWGYWLNEPIYTDTGVFSIEKRKHIIHSFCMKGLIPLIESQGYKFRLNNTQLYRTVLDLLFQLYEGHRVMPYIIDIDNFSEQYETYCYRIDTDAWDSFWKIWGTIQDFEENYYAHRLRYELHSYVWSWLDFERSPTVLDVYEELKEEEAMDESKGKEDPYLQETSKRDYQDRHW